MTDRDTGLNIALCQIRVLDGDREGNFVRIEAAIQEATQRGAHIACFPETCLLGWVNPQAHDLACTIPGEDSQRLANLARQYQVFLCVGLAEKEGDKLYDAALLIDNQGTRLLKHRKINLLSHLMDPPYTPGRDIRVVETRWGRIGLLICADSFRLGLCERMRKQEPDLVLIPYGWAAPGDKWPQHGKKLKKVVRETAATVQAPVIGTDLVGQITHGPWQGMIYGGLSVAANAQGEVLALAKDRQRDIVIVSLNHPLRTKK